MMSEAYAPTKILRYRTAAEMIAAHPVPSDHYHANGVVLLEDSGLDYDVDFVSRLTFPPEWKKYGTVNGLTLPPLVWSQGALRRTQNPLCQLIRDDAMLMKTYSELLRIETGFKLLVNDLFPAYRNIDWRNCTFRFTRTENEVPHVDSFKDGKPFAPASQKPRVKFFLNVDTQPRIWNVGPTLPDLLKHSGGVLGTTLPNDVNMVCHQVNFSGLMKDVPSVRVEIPPRGIVFANGATVVHQVVFGLRMVALEGFVPRECVPTSEWDHLPGWIEAAGYRVVPVSEGFAA